MVRIRQMVKSIGEKVEEHFKKILDELKITYYGKTQANLMNAGIAKALASAPSKSGGAGNNYPDIMLVLYSEETNRYIPVIIEAKGMKNKLEKLDKDGTITQIVPWASDSKEGAKNPHKKGEPNPNAIVSFAVNGAYHYAKNILESEENSFDEIIFIGVNGTELDKSNRLKDPEQKAYYLSKDNKMQPKHISRLDKSWDLLKQKNLGKLFSIIDKLTLSESELQELTHRTENDLEKSVKKYIKKYTITNLYLAR